jgi:hypothetical protein
MDLYEPILEPLTSERKGRPLLSPGVFVRVASILFDPPHYILYTEGLFLKGSFFGVSSFSLDTMRLFHEE